MKAFTLAFTLVTALLASPVFGQRPTDKPEIPPWDGATFANAVTRVSMHSDRPWRRCVPSRPLPSCDPSIPASPAVFEGRHLMTTRTTRSIAVFNDAFILGGVEGQLPAGSYRIETEEELIESLSFVAYRRLETTIALPAIGSGSLKRQVLSIDPLDLAAAQDRDAGRS